MLPHIQSAEFRELCASLLANQIGGRGSRVHVSTNLSAQRQTLLELLVHLGSVLLSGDSMLVCLQSIASQPQNVRVRLCYKAELTYVKDPIPGTYKH